MKSLINQILSRNRFLTGVKPPKDEGNPELDLVKRMLRHLPQPGEQREVEVHLEVQCEKPDAEPDEKDDTEDKPSVEAPEEKPEPKVEVKVVERIVQAAPVEHPPHPAYKFKIVRDSEGLIESVIASPVEAEEAKRASATSLAEAMM